jgi:purine nucleosidase
MPALIVDTDPGADDALALMLLAARTDAEVVAVGSVHGNVPAPVAADNALRVLETLEVDVPVAVGADVPYSGAESTFTALHVHGLDGLGGFAGRPPSRKPSTESAAEQIVRLARDRPGELGVLALGPLTNLAHALDLEPDLPVLLRDVVWCGGAVHVGGNVTARAEANARNDPEGAERVLAAGFALTLVPLDVTAQVWADGDWLDSVAGSRRAFALEWIQHYVEFYTRDRGKSGCVLYDPLAAAVALNPELARYERHQIRVEMVGNSRGATLISSPAGEERRPARIAVRADITRVMTEMRLAFD